MERNPKKSRKGNRGQRRGNQNQRDLVDQEPRNQTVVYNQTDQETRRQGRGRGGRGRGRYYNNQQGRGNPNQRDLVDQEPRNQIVVYNQTDQDPRRQGRGRGGRGYYNNQGRGNPNQTIVHYHHQNPNAHYQQNNFDQMQAYQLGVQVGAEVQRLRTDNERLRADNERLNEYNESHENIELILYYAYKNEKKKNECNVH